ncbi:recombinase family protein [Actinoplanes sp. NPDC049596]|uniref:recombinase family protein n=1 Tax=unclassified Actinoplanes TaxID=2626549 RepID=UPI003425AF0B
MSDPEISGDTALPVLPGVPTVVHTTGILIGYWRVSSRSQDPSRQQSALRAAGVSERWTFGDKITGKTLSRDGLDQALAVARPGDALCVTNLDRLGRNLVEVLTFVRDLTREGIGLVTLLDRIKIDTRTNDLTSQMALLMLGFLGEIELMLIEDRKRSATDNRRASGKKVGRKQAATAEQQEFARLLHAAGDSYSDISRKTGIPRGSLHRYLLAEGQADRLAA